MQSITRLIVCLLLVTLIGATAFGAKRNVVVFVTDDQSPDAGCYGNPVLKTPNIDAIAADGTRFTYAFATTASCSASRSVILTGLQNHANGQYGHQHHYHKMSSYDNILSLPVILDAAGYRTARCGKYHVAPEQVYLFDEKLPGNCRSPVEMADNCKAFIETESDKPFFLYIATCDPHRGNGDADELPYKPNRFGNPAPGKSYPGITEVVYDPKEVIVPGFLPDTPTCRAEIAQYYQSISRVDQGVGRLTQIIKDAGKWDDTLFIYISDHGIAMPGAKTTVYEGGLRTPCIVRNPYVEKRGVVNDAMVSWVDLTPTIVDFAGALDPKGKVRKEVLAKVEHINNRTERTDPQTTRDTKAGEFHGRSFLALLDKTHVEGWDEINASHTFHEIQMYYPMRVVRERRFKLIWNIAYPLPFPFASDLWAAPTWQAQWKLGQDAPYGAKTVHSYIHRPQFELYDLEADPNEGNNLVDSQQYADVLERMKGKLKAFQKRTDDPWIMKWDYE
ncbi:MAG: sulfatase-like hydrolase/transferase [Phycisphaera sp.]|nr:sulfatase-like hydrolase/transferase [Phycisphaera sp.]